MSKPNEKGTKNGPKKGAEEITKQTTKKGTKKGAEEIARQATKAITRLATGKGKTKKTVKLETLPTRHEKEYNKRYNQFEIEYTITQIVDKNTGEVSNKESESTLVHPYLLGLNPEVLSKHPPAGWIEKKEKIWNFLPKFQYWGHLLQHSIEQFNIKYPERYRTLRYVLRHAQADHNAWKTGLKKQGRLEEWTTLRQEATFPPPPDKAEYCLIDPPLTAWGRQQAHRACKVLRKLKHHKFPMPERAFVSPLLRTMETFQIATKNIGIEADQSYILFNLREKEEGNCADILIDEYLSQNEPPEELIKMIKTKTGRYTNYATHDHIYHKMPGKHEWYKESDEDVQSRANTARKDIALMDDGTCVLLVTHSLLIQNDLKCLEDRPRKKTGSVEGREATALTSFMLDEAGMLAILVEGDKPKDEQAAAALRGNLTTVKGRRSGLQKKLGQSRRETAFRNADTEDEKKRLEPVAVLIEQEILKVRDRLATSA